MIHEALLREALAMLAQWHCELHMTAKHVTRAKVRELIERIDAALK